MSLNGPGGEDGAAGAGGAGAGAARTRSGDQEEVESRLLSVDQKRLYFNVRRNDRGRFLKIAEVNRNRRSTVIIPESGWVRMRNMLNDFIAAAEAAGELTPEPPAGAAPTPAPKRAPRAKRAPAPPSPQLWVGNLPWSLSLAELEELFGAYGTVTHCKLWRNRAGRALGIGVVRFAEQEEATAALAALHNVAVGGRPMRIKYDRLADSNAGIPTAAGRAAAAAAGAGTEDGAADTAADDGGMKEDEETELDLTVSDSMDSTVSLSVMSTAMVQDVLNAIKDLPLVGSADAHLTLDGVTLEPSRLIKDYGIRPKACLRLVANE